MKKLIATITACLLLTSCALPSQNNYGEGDVGQTTIVQYGIIKSVRKVDITGNNTGTGAGVGAVIGGVGGSFIGRGSGSLVGLLAGAVIGGVAGAVAEQAAKDRQGIEYVVKFSHTQITASIVQNIAKKDTPIGKGECVMVQTGGSYQRVLPANEEDCE